MECNGAGLGHARRGGRESGGDRRGGWTGAGSRTVQAGTAKQSLQVFEWGDDVSEQARQVHRCAVLRVLQLNGTTEKENDG